MGMKGEFKVFAEALTPKNVEKQQGQPKEKEIARASATTQPGVSMKTFQSMPTLGWASNAGQLGGEGGVDSVDVGAIHEQQQHLQARVQGDDVQDEVAQLARPASWPNLTRTEAFSKSIGSV